MGFLLYKARALRPPGFKVTAQVNKCSVGNNVSSPLSSRELRREAEQSQSRQSILAPHTFSGVLSDRMRMQTQNCIALLIR